MGEPVEVLESSDAEIDRLFPKCGPRILTNRNDLNRNCVSDDNDNYEAPLCTTTIEEEVTSLESSASSSSRMSVDSATPSSTPASHSSNGGPAERDADLSVVSAYSRDERFHSVLDSSYEEGPGSPTSHSLPLKRDHFRLRDSRIEAAGGREVFSQSRSRPSRRRQEETRRSHHHYHHNHFLQQDQPHLQQQTTQQQVSQQKDSRRGSSSSRSNSTSSNTSCGSRSSESRGPPEEESYQKDTKNTPSPLVYETCLSGSTEVVFDDISDWVVRGLTVRGFDTQETKDYRDVKPFIPIPVTSPTPPSRSPSQTDLESDYPEDGESPARVTKIGNVPIAKYEGSPRRYGQPQRLARPGFPRRVMDGDERTRSKGSKKNPDSGRDESRHHLLHAVDVHRPQVHSSNSLKSKPLLDVPDIKFHDQAPELEEIEPISQTLIECKTDDESDGSLPPPIISTLTSTYGSTFNPPENKEAIEPTSLPDIYESYGFEDSETRKVLEEFFFDSGKKTKQEFFDLEYTLKRQHGNSYVGQRLAECEEEGKDDELDLEQQLCLVDHPQIEDYLPESSSRPMENFCLEEPSEAPIVENGDIKESNEIGVSRNFTLSPETTSCDSLDVESEFSVGEAEGSLHSSGKIVSTMPVLEDGLSSGEESDIEVGPALRSRYFPCDKDQAALMTQQILLEQRQQLLQQQESKQQFEAQKKQYESQQLYELQHQQYENEEINDPDIDAGRPFQKGRSLDDHLCRGELPPLALMNQIGALGSTMKPLGDENFVVTSSPNLESPHATSSPHSKANKMTNCHQSPSSSTLTLMKKQITEIEREIALKKPEGSHRRIGPEGEMLPPSLDLQLLDPLNEKVGEPPPPPAPHPHRNSNEIVENGSTTSTPGRTPGLEESPSRVIGHLHSPQFTPVSAPISGPQLLSSMGSLTSPIEIIPHMVSGHPATHDLHHKQGNSISPSRESVEAAIADIKQAIRLTKNLPLKSHPQERQDKGPVWVPRNNRRDDLQQPYSQNSCPTSPEQEERCDHRSPPPIGQPHMQILDSSPSGASSSRSRDRSLHEEEDGDTDQETDRLLGQQRSDDPGFLEEKSWRRLKSRPAIPQESSEGLEDQSNESSPSSPTRGTSNHPPSSPLQMVPNKIKSKKDKEMGKKKGRSKEVMIHEPAVLIEGVLFRARYLGSTQLVSEGQPTKTTRMMQAEEAVSRIKAPEGEAQPSTEVDLFISTEKIMVLNTDLKEIMMDHALRTISYIADIGDLVVLMARRRVMPTDEQASNPAHRLPKMICHVFESDEAQFIAQSIGQAFQVAYLEFLKANGIEDHSFVKEMDYQEVLNSQEIFGDELQMFAKKELQKEVVVPKMKGEILGVVVVESGWGSMVPTVVIANLSPTGAAAKCGQLNIGDQIIAINGVSLVGLPLSNCQNYIKNTKYNTAVKLTVVPCPPVVEVKIRRPDTKYQLGFSVQNGVICSLLRGGIAERGGVRVGHRIIDINSQSVVAVPHEKIVNLLATSVGEIRMKTMPTSIFRLLTGQESPQYI